MPRLLLSWCCGFRIFRYRFAACMMRTVAVGVAVCLAAALLPLQGWWITGGTALVTVFLAVGYVFTKRVAVAVPLAYSVLDALGFAMLQSASVGGSIIRGAIDALNDITKDDAIGSSAAAPVEITLPQYSLIVFAATLVLNLLMLGSLVAFGSAAHTSTAMVSPISSAVSASTVVGACNRCGLRCSLCWV